MATNDLTWQRYWGGIWTVTLSWFLFTAVNSVAQSSPGWSNVFTRIENQWPRVPQLRADDLARQLKLPAAGRPALIDVRSRDEFAVSHLPGAVRAQSSREIKTVVRDIPATRPLVLYCSVGIRSSEAAQALLDSGRTNVFNLQGSIFQWANEGRVVVSNGTPVTVVHPYNARWGRLLDASHHPGPRP
jgi:rhodanese-related sulfurtransferase